MKTMKRKATPLRIAGLVLLGVTGLLADSWKLPQDLPVKDNGPRAYRFTVDYTTSDTKGQIIHWQRVVGDYTRALPGGDAIWKNVMVAESNGPDEIRGQAQKREFMEGFRYHNSPGAGDSMKPDFFKGFPATAVLERNLVWDAGMIEMFGQNYFEHLTLNEPYRAVSSEEMNLPGVGKFQNRNVELTWTGRSQRNGQDCAVIGYSAYFNPLEIANAGMTLKGRSHYWGEIWVSLTTKQIEYATLQEDVLGELKLAGQDSMQVISVFRSGVFEPIAKK